MNKRNLFKSRKFIVLFSIILTSILFGVSKIFPQFGDLHIIILPVLSLILGPFAILGFAIGTFKIPDISTFEFTKNVGGEAIDDVIKRWISFKRKSNRIYVYKEEDAKDDK